MKTIVLAIALLSAVLPAYPGSGAAPPTGQAEKRNDARNPERKQGAPVPSADCIAMRQLAVREIDCENFDPDDLGNADIGIAAADEIKRLSDSDPLYTNVDHDSPAWCDSNALQDAIGAGYLADESMRRKMATGFLPAQRPTKYLRKPPGAWDASERIQVPALVSRHPAGKAPLTLVYGEFRNWRYNPGDPDSDTCVWLVSEGKIVARDRIKEKVHIESLWSQLNVEVASRRRLLPKNRSGSAECPPDTSSTASVRTEAQIRDADQALSRFTRILLPYKIRTALNQSKNDRLIIVPIRDFRTVPFAALPIGPGSLIDKFSLIVTPVAEVFTGNEVDHDFDVKNSAHIFGQRREVPPKVVASAADYLVVANPDLSGDEQCWEKLPHAEKEGEFASSVLSIKSITGRAANFSTVTDRLKQGEEKLKLIYLATHGLSDPVNPADGSLLALAERHLRAADLRGLKFKRSPVVVMSACQTALGKTSRAGIFGLVEAWRFAGARQIVMSLWDVSDSGTELLMRHFIQNFHAQNLTDPEGALAIAIRTVKAQFPDPAVWASFGVYGRPYDHGIHAIVQPVDEPPP